MERQKHFLIILLLIISLFSVKASPRSDIYKAFISNDLNLWKNVLDDMHQQKNKSNDFKLELLNYAYGYIGWCIAKKNYTLAKQYLEMGDVNLLALEKLAYKPSWTNSYKSAFYGFRIGLSMIKAPILGPKSVACANLAMKQDVKNPYGFIQYANIQYYMPPVFGGSKSEALNYYLMAQKIMEGDPVQIKENWNYLNLLTMIAQTYTQLNDFQSAKAYFVKILNIEPNFLWVKNKLYPNCLKKINQNT